jgi:hypothetical protein
MAGRVAYLQEGEHCREAIVGPLQNKCLDRLVALGGRGEPDDLAGVRVPSKVLPFVVDAFDASVSWKLPGLKAGLARVAGLEKALVDQLA